MLKRILYLTAAVSVLGVMGFGASEAYAARAVMPASCEDNNWCTQSGAGDEQCNLCCGEPQGLCVFYGPPEGPQGCVCFGR